MRSKFKFIICLLFVFVASLCVNTIHISAEESAKGVIKADCSVYKKADKDSDKICKLNKNKKVTVLKKTKNKKWYYIKFTTKDANTNKKIEKKGYVPVSKVNKEKTGGDVVDYAKNFVGNPYKYGGTSLTKGTDCSGFVLSVYKKFGYDLPHSSKSQRTVGKKVSNLSKAKPGDIICYRGHVAIYMGNNKIIHASTYKTGIKISNNANYRKIVAIRRVI